jgi:hypothetical protein
MRRVFTLLLFFIATYSSAQTISFATDGGTYTQNFDGLPSSGGPWNSATAGPSELKTTNFSPSLPNDIPGWYLQRTNGTPATLYSGIGNSTTGSAYSFGVAGTNPVTDRALGALASNSSVHTWGALFTNNTGVTLQQITITVTCEQWRRGGSGNLQTIPFTYKLGATGIDDASGFTAVPALDLYSLSTIDTAKALDGNLAAYRVVLTYTIGGISWAAGQVLAIRWSDNNDLGNDDALATDDFSLSASSTPVIVNYYNTKANLGLNNLGTWSSTIDGTGPSPANFTGNYQVFNIINQTNANLTGAWTVSGASSKAVLGPTLPFINLTIPAASPYTGLIDVINGYLNIASATLPTLGTLATGSIVEYSATSPVTIQQATYWDLKLTNSTKTFPPGTTTINGNLTVNAVTDLNGSPSPFSTVSLVGNATFLNGSTFQPSPAGDGNRLTLSMDGVGLQTITGNGTNLLLFRLDRSVAAANATNSVITLAANTNLTVGNNSGGGLRLTQSATKTTQLNLGANTLTLVGAATVSAIGSNAVNCGTISSTSGNVTVTRTTGAASGGTLRFNTGAVINNFTINFSGTASGDSIFLDNTVTVNNLLTLTNGKIICNYGVKIILPVTASISGGGPNAYVSGTIEKTGLQGLSMKFPLGQFGKYAPVELNNWSGNNTYSVMYRFEPYGTYTVDPATLAWAATIPAPYIVSHQEYWLINPTITGQTVDLVLYWNDANSYITDPSNLRITGFDGTDWNDIGVDNYSGTATVGSIDLAAVSQFGPITFAELVAGILPLKLHSFEGKILNNVSQLKWVASCNEQGSYFVLERSNDAVHFTALATIETGGVCTDKIFNYSDLNAKTGRNYYRLKLVNRSGKYEYSNMVLLNNRSKDLISIMQNPVKDVLRVNLGALNNDGSLQVIDMNGRVLAEKMFKTTDYIVEINTSSLPAGAYVLRVMSNGNVIAQQFVK